MLNYKAAFQKTGTVDSTNFVENDYPLIWSMSRNERFAFLNLLQKIKPEVSLEIGTYEGGSLQVISSFSKKVITCDIDPRVEKKLSGKFDNVEFSIGDSSEKIPLILEKIIESGKHLEFVLIDGDHSKKAVQRDIELVLKYIPQKPMHIILHDSFNPDCRAGMLAVDYQAYKHVHFVEIDYITGAFNHDGLHKQMWGGFAHIILLPEERTGFIKVNECQKKLFKVVYKNSIHRFKKFFILSGMIKSFFKKS